MSVEKLYMYKSFTSKAIFHGVAGEEEERWDRLQRWTYEKQEFILACVCAERHAVWTKIPPSPQSSWYESNKMPGM